MVGRKRGVVDLNNPVVRYTKNPILTAKDVNKVWKNPEWQVVTVHNAGAIEFDGGMLLMFRSHLRSGVSVLGIARSKDGFSKWKIDGKPVMMSATLKDDFGEGVNKKHVIENESGGVEDPRIVKIGNEYVVMYHAYHARIKDRVRVAIATTKDFRKFVRYGHATEKNMRNMVMFSEKIAGKYVALFRINEGKGIGGGKYTAIRIGYSKDYKKGRWKLRRGAVIKTGGGPSAIQDKIGPGAPPIKTKKGWLNIFHGVRMTMADNPYVLSVALHDLKNPEKVKVSNIPILFPTEADAKVKSNMYVHVDNVVFTCGAIRKKNGEIVIYYGGDDSVMNICVSHEDILAELCEKYGQDALTGGKTY